MSIPENEFIKEIAKNYSAGKLTAEEAFEQVKFKHENFESNLSLIPIYFDYEEKISFYFFKENQKLIAEDSFNSYLNEKEQKTKNILFSMIAKLYSTSVFNDEKYFISCAVKEAYQEIFKDSFLLLEKEALKHTKEMIIKLLNSDSILEENKQDHMESVKSMYRERFNHSVYKEEMISYLDSF